MRNIRLTLEYDGTAYAGWQVQPNAPTVQEALEQALETLLQHPVRVMGSGRTDAGVHALGQTANFLTERPIPLKGVFHGLNSLLPGDIAVRRVDAMPPGFDSRRSAREKTYRYRLHVAPAPSAFARRTSWRIPFPLDEAAMAEAARILEGTHDFAAFRAAGCDAATTVRTLRRLSVSREGEFIVVEAVGNGFLRHMVRILVGTLVEVGRGKMAPDRVRDLLEHPARERAGPTAPPQGLFLVCVRYDEQPLESYP